MRPNFVQSPSAVEPGPDHVSDRPALVLTRREPGAAVAVVAVVAVVAAVATP